MFSSIVQSLSRVRLFASPWTVARQAPLSVAFPRQGYWSGLPRLPCPSQGDLADPGSNLQFGRGGQILYCCAIWEAQPFTYTCPFSSNGSAYWIPLLLRRKGAAAASEKECWQVKLAEQKAQVLALHQPVSRPPAPPTGRACKTHVFCGQRRCWKGGFGAEREQLNTLHTVFIAEIANWWPRRNLGPHLTHLCCVTITNV